MLKSVLVEIPVRKEMGENGKVERKKKKKVEHTEKVRLLIRGQIKNE